VVFGSELVAGPDGGGSGEGVEVVEREESGGGFVMIAADEDVAQTAGALDHLVGRCSVADYVAEVGDEIVGRSCGQAGFEGFEVGVNVAKKKDSQSTPDELGDYRTAETEAVHGGCSSIRKRAKRAIIVSQKARHIARLARILRRAKNACSG
jgi:hypothetical protein